MRKLLHLISIVGIVAVLWGCAPGTRRCSETTTRNDGPSGSYDYHYSRTCVDAPAK